MATVYSRKLKSGKVWYGQVKRDGVWFKYNTKIADRAAALAHAEFVESEYAAGRDPFREQAIGQTITELKREYFVRCEAENLRTSTIRSYDFALRKLVSIIGDVSVKSITAVHIERFVDGMVGLEQTTIADYLSSVRAFFNYCAKRPLAKVWTPPEFTLPEIDTDPHVEFFTGDERERLLDTAAAFTTQYRGGQRFQSESGVQPYPPFPFRNLIALLMWTGLRINEAMSLRWVPVPKKQKRPTWCWVDLRQGVIVVPASFAKGRRTRLVPILPELKDLLESWPRTSGDKLFPFSGESGALRTKWKLLCKTADVPEHDIHALRATYAVMLREGGVDIDTIMTLLGHQDKKTTERYYVLLGRDQLHTAIMRHHHLFTTGLLPDSSKSLKKEVA